MELKNTVNGHESKFILQFVQDIALKLHFVNLSVDGNLVGMDTRVNNVVSSLEPGSGDFRMIGIKGIGGGGKTTLARAVFDHISIWFEGKSFVENVKEVSKGSGLKELQKQVLSDVLNDQSIAVTSVSDGKNKMGRMMGSRKVLVVLDDVDDIEQLQALVGEITWFKPGSRIIITTRDQQLLVAHGVNFIHDINLLSDEEAICLFSKYAFKRPVPNEGYEVLSRKVVHYAAGLPLTIKVLGSHLCGRSECEWESALERLKTIPWKVTLEKLELSYNGLENDQKEIFLDVVCILKGEMEDDAIRILESCGFNAQIGLRVLEQKSLITISSTEGLRFHDHIEEMGRNIVRRLHPHDPRGHNRLWIKEEIEDILVKELGTEATTCIKLKTTDLHPAIIMKGLRKMKELRFLFVNTKCETCILDEVSKYLPNALQSLNWRGYPFRSLPKMFQANKLVNLELVGSNISELWEGRESKVNTLRFLDLTFSKVKTFDLSMTPNLEKLNLQACVDFSKLQIPFECTKLKFLILSGSSVRDFNLGSTPNLMTLGLHGCKAFENLHLPVECPNLKFLDLSLTLVRYLNLERIPNLKELLLGGCKKFVELHLPIKCRDLKSLNLRGSMVSNLNLEMTPCLEELLLGKCNEFVELHMPVECQNLKSLNLSGSKVRNLNLQMTPHLETLDLSKCYYFFELQVPIECQNLKSLNLSGSKVSSLNLGMIPHLEDLLLEGCNKFLELHLPIECMNLKSLNLSGSKVRNLNLGMTRHLETLELSKCNEFVELYLPFECPNLKTLNLSCSKVSNFNIGITPYRKKLLREACNEFVELHLLVECPNLKSLSLSGLKVSNINLGMTQHLKMLDLPKYNGFVELPRCQYLRFLKLSGSNIGNFNLGMTPHLEELHLKGCDKFVELHLPVECKNLKSLDLSGSKVSNLNLGMTPHLQWLGLEGCSCLQEIQAPVGCFKKLVYLNLTGSLRFKHLLFDNLKPTPTLDSMPTLELTAESLDTCLLHPNNSSPKFQFKCKYDEPRSSWSGNLEKLISFGLCACTNLESFSTSICSLQGLGKLTLEGSIPVPKDLYQLESLEELTLWMKEIKHLPDSICMLKHLKSLELKSCWLLEQLPEDLDKLECLTKLLLTNCTQLQDIPNNIYNMKCLRHLHISYCSKVKELQEECGRLECARTNLEPFLASICGLKHLRELTLEGRIPEVPKDLYQLESLEKLTLWMKEIKHLPDSICMLKHLKSLNLESCLLLEQLPIDLGRLENLEELDLTDCISLRDIPNSICNIKCLKHLRLPSCIPVGKLEEETGLLECSIRLRTHGKGMRHLPHSIYQMKGLRIFGSIERLKLYGFIPVIKTVGSSYVDL